MFAGGVPLVTPLFKPYSGSSLTTRSSSNVCLIFMAVYGVVLLLKDGIWLLAAWKPINRPGWWKGKFQMCAPGVGGSLSRGWLPCWQSGGKRFYRQREGAACRNSTVSSGSHLEIGHRWSDQRRLCCSRDSSSLVPGSVCFPFFEASSRSCGNLCYGHGLVIMWLTSPPVYRTGVYKTAHRGTGGRDGEHI